MAYQTGTATSQQDFLTKLFAFATANGWTQDDFDVTNKHCGMHINTVFVQFRWDAQAGGGIAVYQSLAWAAGQPYSIASGAGNGAATGVGAQLGFGRVMNAIGDGPYTSHHFFALGSPATSLFAALEYSPGLWSFFGAGEMEKFGTWTGGEWASASYWSQNGGDIADASSISHSVLLDGGNQLDDTGGSIHTEGLPGMAGATKWSIAVFSNSNSALPNNDNAGNARERVLAGMRSGPYANAFSRFETSQLQGYVPLLPVPIFYRNRTTVPHRLYFLGYLPNVRTVNLAAFAPTNEIVLGPDTWKVFPMKRKVPLGGSTPQSANAGIAFRKA